MKKVVLKLDVHDDKSKKKAMREFFSGLEGLDSISMDMKDKKLTVTGDIDLVCLLSELGKLCTEIVSVGPAKEEKKKEKPKKEEAKKDVLEMKKVVLKWEVSSVSGLEGLDSISMDMKDQKLTVTGDIDPVCLVSKLRKLCRTEIVSVGPAKEEKKKEEPKKDEAKKDGDKKKDPKEEWAELMKAYNAYNPPMSTHYYVRSVEEDPNACVIC